MTPQEITAQQWANKGFVLNRYVDGVQGWDKITDDNNFEIAAVFADGSTNYNKAVDGVLEEIQLIPFDSNSYTYDLVTKDIDDDFQQCFDPEECFI